MRQDKIIYLTSYTQVSDGLVSRPGGSRNTPSRFMLHKPGSYAGYIFFYAGGGGGWGVLASLPSRKLMIEVFHKLRILLIPMEFVSSTRKKN